MFILHIFILESTQLPVKDLFGSVDPRLSLKLKTTVSFQELVAVCSLIITPQLPPYERPELSVCFGSLVGSE